MHILTRKFSIAAFAIAVFTVLPQLAAVSAAAPVSPSQSLQPISVATSTLSGTVAAPVATTTAPAPAVTPDSSGPDVPTKVAIPSIGLYDRIIPLGINAKGEMDVPNGKTNDIGWYEYGPVPGETGSAVLDAHVFAALKYLKNVPVDADIYVTLRSGAVKHFIVRQSTVYALAVLPSSVLFDHGPGQWLNIITCAGRLTPDRSTYDHRLIVFAELVS